MRWNRILPFLFPILFLLACANEQTRTTENTSDTASKIPDGMILIPGGHLNMGGDNQQADQNEFPKHEVEISSFLMDITEVTNAAFLKFVAETGYITIAERPLDWEAMKKQLPANTPKPSEEILKPGALVFVPTKQPVSLQNPEAWWQWTLGASWKHPQGPGSNIDSIMNHPVVQIAWEDAQAYAEWAGKRLPTEVEWEWAARGGKKDLIYPWGNESINEGVPKANFYQGLFPYKNEFKDGYLTTAPVKSFSPNGYGLYDMAGNVWEWTSDWYNTNYYIEVTSDNKTIYNPKGADRPYNARDPYSKERIMKGGSFLCNASYCASYRISSRMATSMDSSMEHLGFRTVATVEMARNMNNK